MRTILYFFLVIISFNAFAQEPVHWDFSYNSTTGYVNITAKIDSGWHIYSQYLKENSGPIATAFEFESTELVQTKGKTKEPKPLKEYDENFESELLFFKDSVSFQQKVRSKEATSIKGTLTYMACNETMCLPPVDVPFEIKLK